MIIANHTNVQSATKKKATWRRTDSLYAVRRTEEFLKASGCDFFEEYKSYMYARVMWAVAKSFAVSNDRELFRRLAKEYDVRLCMKRTSKDKNMLVAAASIIYLIHPSLFFYIIRLKK